MNNKPIKNKFCTIYLVRHGVTDWNIEGKIQGNTDIPLNTEGKIQAKELAKELKHIKFDKALSSDLLRAKQTAEIIAKEHKLIVEATEVLRERNFGYLEGKSSDLVKDMQRLIGSLEEDKRFSYKYHPSIESDGEIAERLLTLIREVAVANSGKNVLVVTHGGVIRVLSIKMGLFTHADDVKVRNLAYLKFDCDGSDIVIRDIKGIEKL